MRRLVPTTSRADSEDWCDRSWKRRRKPNKRCGAYRNDDSSFAYVYRTRTASYRAGLARTHELRVPNGNHRWNDRTKSSESQMEYDVSAISEHRPGDSATC